MKLAKKFVDIMSFINHQLSIDISGISSAGSRPKTFMNVDFNKLSIREQTLIKSLGATSNKFNLRYNGGLGMALFVI